MRISGGTLAGLAVAAGMLFLGAPRAFARKSTPSTPRLAGTYAFRLEKICQPDFFGGSNQDTIDYDALYFYFDSPGSFQNQIGVVTFNPKTLSVSGSTLKVKGDLVTQNIGGAGFTGFSSNPFTQTSEAMSGTYSTTATTFTINDSTSNKSTLFQAVYGAYANTTAHVVFFQTIFQSNGSWCEDSGELQFK